MTTNEILKYKHKSKQTQGGKAVRPIALSYVNKICSH